MQQGFTAQPDIQNEGDQTLASKQTEAMQVIETADAPQANIKQAVQTLQTEVLPALEAILASEEAKGRNADTLYMATAKEQLGRARRYVNEGKERLGEAA